MWHVPAQLLGKAENITTVSTECIFFFNVWSFLWQLHSYRAFRFLHNHAPISGKITWILCHLNSSTMCSLILFVLVSSHVLFYVFLHLFYQVFCESCSSFMYPVYHACSLQNSLNISICCFIVFGVYDFIILPKHESLCYLSSFRLLNSSTEGIKGMLLKVSWSVYRVCMSS